MSHSYTKYHGYLKIDIHLLKEKRKKEKEETTDINKQVEVV